jgi:hypothetical protein
MPSTVEFSTIYAAGPRSGQCTGGRTRTLNGPLWRRLLFQLSYTRIRLLAGGWKNKNAAPSLVWVGGANAVEPR